MPDDKRTSPSRIRRFRSISLRAFFLITTVVMITVGYYLSRVRRQRAAVQTIEKNGGQVFYDYQFADGSGNLDARPPTDANSSSIPDWMISRFGVDAFHRVVSVNMNYCVQWKHNTWVHVGGMSLGKPASWRALGELPHVRHLVMDYGQCPDGSFQHIRALKNLESLRIQEVNIGDEAAVCLAELKELRSVWMIQCGLGDESMSAFAQLPKLKTLSVVKNALSNDGLVAISSAPQLTNLYVGGEGCTIDDNGLPHLAKLEYLKIVGLQHTLITDAGLQHFASMPSVKELMVGYTKATWKGADRFKKEKRTDVIFQGGGLRQELNGNWINES